MTRLTRHLTRRGRSAACSCSCSPLLASGCKFDGAYDLPLPGNKVERGRRLSR